MGNLEYFGSLGELDVVNLQKNKSKKASFFPVSLLQRTGEHNTASTYESTKSPKIRIF